MIITATLPIIAQPTLHCCLTDGITVNRLVLEGVYVCSCFAQVRKCIIHLSILGLSTKTFVAKPETVKRDWYVVDAEGKTLGRLASEVALRLRGKHKPEYTPHVDCGDYIVVVNAEKIQVTGNKAEDKIYYSHSGFPGGLKSISFEKLIVRKPEMVIESAVRGMLPKGPLGRAMFRKMKVFVGAQHNHAAQQPQVLDI